MIHLQPAADLPLTFNSIEEYEEGMCKLGVNQRVMQLGKGKFRSDLALLRVQNTEFYAEQYSRAVSVLLKTPKNVMYLLLPRCLNGELKISGKNISKNTLLLMPETSELEAYISDRSTTNSIAMPQDRFNTLAQLADPAFSIPTTLTALNDNSSMVSHLWKTIINLASQAEHNIYPEEIDNLLIEIIADIGQAAKVCPTNNLTNYGVRAAVARKVQEYLEESYRTVASLEYICQHTGVGVRTTQRCFMEYFGLTVSKYLQMLRLDSARRELLSSSPRDTSVTSIALNNGFTHFGRFSVGFSQRFGVTPRQVLVATNIY